MVFGVGSGEQSPMASTFVDANLHFMVLMLIHLSLLGSLAHTLADTMFGLQIWGKKMPTFLTIKKNSCSYIMVSGFSLLPPLCSVILSSFSLWCYFSMKQTDFNLI